MTPPLDLAAIEARRKGLAVQNAYRTKSLEEYNIIENILNDVLILIARMRELESERDALKAQIAEANRPPLFQDRVAPWMRACFGDVVSADVLERCDRFIEESLELVQSKDYPVERAHALVDYVFGRTKGEPFQEVGGVMVTLSALCNAIDVDLRNAADTELKRVWGKIDQIRAKQAAKPVGSALPVPAAKAEGKDQ